MIAIMEATDIKNQIQSAVREIDELRNKKAEVSFVRSAEDLEEGAGLDVVLYLSIKLRKNEDLENIPDSLKINTSITLNKLGRI